MTQLAGHAVPHDAASHSLADDESDARRCAVGTDEKVHAQERSAGAPATTKSLGEVRRRAQPVNGGKHQSGWSVRPRARCGPYGAAPRGSRDPRGSTCAAESRASWRDGGCSAGRCACSRKVLLDRGGKAEADLSTVRTRLTRVKRAPAPDRSPVLPSAVRADVKHLPRDTPQPATGNLWTTLAAGHARLLASADPVFPRPLRTSHTEGPPAAPPPPQGFLHRLFHVL